MQRLLAIIAATATAAAVAAAISLPAGADDGGQPADPDGVKLAACLRDHGAAVPADAQGRALKNWIGDAASRPEVQAALKACGMSVEKHGLPPEQLMTCLRDHGLNPPSSLEEFKPWFVGTVLATDAGKAAAKACGIETRAQGPGAGKPGTCGDAVGPADGAKQPDDAEQPDAAATPAA
jgi:hypothetical protein